MKIYKKLFTSILIGTISLTSFTAFLENNNAQAKRINGRTNYVEKNKDLVAEELLNPADYGTTYQSDLEENSQFQTRAGGTWFVKKSIRLILNNKYKAADAVGKIAGNSAKQEFLKRFYGIEPQLRQLLRWSDIPAQAIHDAVYRGMMKAGARNDNATRIAHAIKQAVGWML